MMNCQPSLLSWGDASIAWIAQHLRASWLSPIMENISDLGQSAPIFGIIALCYWFWNARYTKYIAYSVFLALLINLWLKGIVMECRPPAQYWMENVGHSYSFPSGHSQVSIALWAGLAYYVQSKKLSKLFLLIGILIALSRPYLGVHYIHDIVVGLLLGLMALSVGIIFEKKQFAPLKGMPIAFQGLCVLVGLVLYNFIVNSPSGSSIRCTGAFFGFWLGCQWVSSQDLNHRFRYSPLVLQLIIGFGGMFLLMNEIKFSDYNFPSFSLTLIKFIQYALVGLWISYGAPTIFMKANLLLKKVIVDRNQIL